MAFSKWVLARATGHILSRLPRTRCAQFPLISFQCKQAQPLALSILAFLSERPAAPRHGTMLSLLEREAIGSLQAIVTGFLCQFVSHAPARLIPGPTRLKIREPQKGRELFINWGVMVHSRCRESSNQLAAATQPALPVAAIVVATRASCLCGFLCMVSNPRLL